MASTANPTTCPPCAQIVRRAAACSVALHECRGAHVSTRRCECRLAQACMVKCATCLDLDLGLEGMRDRI